MTSKDRLERLAKPTAGRRSRRAVTGESRPCPADPRHGRLLIVSGERDYCPHADHTRAEPTRCFWPALA